MDDKYCLRFPCIQKLGIRPKTCFLFNSVTPYTFQYISIFHLSPESKLISRFSDLLGVRTQIPLPQNVFITTTLLVQLLGMRKLSEEWGSHLLRIIFYMHDCRLTPSKYLSVILTTIERTLPWIKKILRLPQQLN